MHVTNKLPLGLKEKSIVNLSPTILINKNNPLVDKIDERITFEDLAKQNMMIDKDNILDYFVETCNVYSIKGNIEFINGDWETVKNYVKKLGIHLYSSVHNTFEEFKDSDLISKNISHLLSEMELRVIVKKRNIENKYFRNFLLITGSYKSLF